MLYFISECYFVVSPQVLRMSVKLSRNLKHQILERLAFQKHQCFSVSGVCVGLGRWFFIICSTCWFSFTCCTCSFLRPSGTPEIKLNLGCYREQGRRSRYNIYMIYKMFFDTIYLRT